MMTTIALTALHLALALFIIGSCICRVNLMRPRKHKYTWTIKYTLMAAFAGGEFLDALLSTDWFTWFELAGLLAIALHLIATQKHWKGGPPAVVEKTKGAT